jgi:hypothetical protein
MENYKLYKKYIQEQVYKIVNRFKDDKHMLKNFDKLLRKYGDKAIFMIGGGNSSLSGGDSLFTK